MKRLVLLNGKLHCIKISKNKNIKFKYDPTNWIFEASGLHIPSKARGRNEWKYYQINTTFLNTYGSHREKPRAVHAITHY